MTAAARVRAVAGRLRGRLSLPLFIKELTEAAARRRTYVVRTVYAGTLFLLAILFARDVLFPEGDAFTVLGRGGELYAIVMLIQFGGVYLFLPAITAAAITAEKERNTLGLLFLTKLSPTKIVLEKYLGRVFPMLCLTLLSLPLLGVAYTLGGLDFSLLFEGVVRLAATILMIGAIGIACSAWCRTTAGAFMSTYAVLLMLFPGLPFIAEELGLFRIYSGGLAQSIARAGVAIKLLPEEQASIMIFFGPYPVIRWLEMTQRQYAGVLPTTFLATRSAWVTLWQATPLLLPTIAGLVTARLVLVPRAEVKPKRYFARAFASLDRWFRDLNDRYAKGIEVIKTRGGLPDYAPVAWRETTKTTLGSFRYLVRMLLIIEVPVLFIGLLGAGSSDGFGTGLLSLIAALLWGGSALIVAAKAAGLFPGERARQSLDVLLSTPMPTRQVLREKLAGVWRLILVASVPMMTTWGLIAYLRYSVGGTFSDHGVLFLMLAVSVTATHLALTAYLALLIGLRVPTQSRAVLASITVLTTICLVGPIAHLVYETGRTTNYYSPPPVGLSLYSPATVLGELLDTRRDPSDLLLLLLGNTVLYGGLALTLRWACYHYAGQWLGRDENEPAVPILERPTPRTSADGPASMEPTETATPAEAIG